MILVAAAVLALPCFGVIAAIAIPTLIRQRQEAKMAEAEGNLVRLYDGAAAYYAASHPGPDGRPLTRCTVGSASTRNVPSGVRTAAPAPLEPSFEAIGFTLSEPVYYRYEILGVGGCGHPPSAALYTFRAAGDLDYDGIESRFDLTAGSDAANELARSASITRLHELE